MGDDGLIQRAEQASQHQANAEAADSEAMDELNKYLEEVTIKKVTLEQAKNDSMLTATENAKLIIGNDVVWIPAGFKVHEDSAEIVDEGIVITDGTNEFVWVPVDETSFDLMFNTAEPAVALSGSTGVTSSYYSNLRVRSGDSYAIATVTNGAYSSTTTIREPDLVTFYDESKNKYYEQAGFASAQEMAQAFVDDYTNMRASIEKYDGFYIGRYELTGSVDSPTVKAGAVLTGINWYKLYKACRKVVTDDTYATSTMIWGCQWDETMNWLKNTKFKDNTDAVDVDSSSWGNYYDVTVLASDGETETGITTYTMANKIYDLAGNYAEWTQEEVKTSYRTSRGGTCWDTGSDSPASYRDGYNPHYSNDYSGLSTRATLYINL